MVQSPRMYQSGSSRAGDSWHDLSNKNVIKQKCLTIWRLVSLNRPKRFYASKCYPDKHDPHVTGLLAGDSEGFLKLIDNVHTFLINIM